MFRGWRRPEKEFFEEIEREIEAMNEMINRLHRGDEPLVYGFSLRIGSDGVPHMERFGNLTSRETIDNTREPFTSSIVDEKNNELRITAEMPGIRKENIEVNATGNEVVIRAEAGERKYYKNVKTPSIDPESARAKYNNGVLEITFKLKEPVRTGKAVKIE